MHSPLGYVFTAGPYTLTDLTKGPAFTFKRAGQKITTTAGLKGETTDTEDPSDVSTLEISVRQSSPDNANLQKLFDARTQFQVIYHDYGNGEDVRGLFRIANPPETVAGPEIGERKWLFTGVGKYIGGAGYSA
jgi:hypothetical protein